MVGAVRLDESRLLSRTGRSLLRDVPPFGLVQPRVGLIYNRRSHRNREREQQLGPFRAPVDARVPADESAVIDALRDFAANGIDLLIVDGGDGTVRDVLSAADQVFGADMPRIAVLPSGKTNALAIDLGIPVEWTVDDVIAAAVRGSGAVRSPVEVERSGQEDARLRGFLIGAGAFVRATSLAQHPNRWGLFNGFAVGFSLTLALGRTFFGFSGNSWRRGEAMTLQFEDGSVLSGQRYLLLASTLETLPLGVKPFGPTRPGLKLLSVDAPPRRMVAGVAALLSGSTASWLERLGYRRRDIDCVAIDLPGGFILDGEKFAGGRIVIRRGAPIRFVVP